MAGLEYKLHLSRATCSFGNTENYINIGTDHGVYVYGNEQGETVPLLNEGDCTVGVHITHFGTCSAFGSDADEAAKRFQSAPLFSSLFKKAVGAVMHLVGTGVSACTACSPEIRTRWCETKEDYLVDGLPALTENSFITCRKGGVIRFVKSPGAEEKSPQDIVNFVNAVTPTAVAYEGMSAGPAVSRGFVSRSVSQHATPASLPEFPLQLGSSGDSVRLLQIALIAKLNELGEDTSELKPDGDFGPKTLEAVNKYKDRVMRGGNTESSGYRGLVGLQTWTSLGLLPSYDYDNATLAEGRRNDETLVRVLQTDLKERGLYNGAIDGVFDRELTDSVNAFKTKMHLGNTGEFQGKVGPQTWEYLGLSKGYNEPYFAPLTRPVALPLPSAAVKEVSSEYLDTAYHDHIHMGIDIPVPTGTSVLSVAPGKVTEVGDQGDRGRGKYIYVEHIIDGRKITAVYQHNSVNSVNVGKDVTTGTKIAEAGNTGDSRGSHLHIEFKENGNYISPRQVFPRLPFDL